jgi:hypothetical protein
MRVRTEGVRSARRNPTDGSRPTRRGQQLDRHEWPVGINTSTGIKKTPPAPGRCPAPAAKNARVFDSPVYRFVSLIASLRSEPFLRLDRLDCSLELSCALIVSTDAHLFAWRV